MPLGVMHHSSIFSLLMTSSKVPSNIEEQYYDELYFDSDVTDEETETSSKGITVIQISISFPIGQIQKKKFFFFRVKKSFKARTKKKIDE